MKILQELVKEWYEFNEYEIKKTTKKGFIAVDPKNNKTIHVETDLLEKSFEEHGKEHGKRFKKVEKFYKSKLGMNPSSVIKRSIFEYGSSPGKKSINTFESESGSEFVHIWDLLKEVYDKIKDYDPKSKVIPYDYLILRILSYTISL